VEQEGTLVWLEGFQSGTAPFPNLKLAAISIVVVMYGEQPDEWQTREKCLRNAEIYRRYLRGEDSGMLAKAYGLTDRRVRNIIEHERRA
jgi:hypothetical protein